MKFTRFALPLAATCLLAACATPAPLKGAYSPITPQEAASTDATGTMVRWGGRIVSVEPQAQRTCFEMISLDLQDSGRPRSSGDRIGGRFIACRAGFYDPEEFERGRQLTVVGSVAGADHGKVGEFNYTYPHVAADTVYLWPRRAMYAQSPYYDPWFSGYGGPWGPYWGPYWGPFWGGTVVVREHPHPHPAPAPHQGH